MNRTNFNVSPLLLVVAISALAAASTASAQRAGCMDLEPAGSEIRIVDANEPGEPLIVSGRALDGDGQPLVGVKVRVFHTDAAGYYSAGGMDESKSRLCGVLETAADGSYLIETIRPGEYATGGPRAHVHFDAGPPTGTGKFFTVSWSDIEDGGDPEAGNRGSSTRPMVRLEDGTFRLVYDLVFR